MPFKFAFTCLLVCLLACSATNAQVRYAENFGIEEHDRYQLLTVRNVFRNSEQVHRYALVPRGQSLPDLPSGIAIIRTPVERIVAMETVYIGQLAALDRLEPVIGVATADFISDPTIRRRLAEGDIRRVQIGQALDVERLLTLQPDLILSSISDDPAFDMPAKLKRTGLPIVVSASYMERHPLARAEWIKFIGAFVGRSEAANTLFDQTEARYRDLSARIDSVESRPTILCGAPYSGTWHVPGGRSYTAQIIEDAGGHYLWRDDTSRGGVPLDLESVFLKGAHADIWINPSGHQTLASLLAADPRFSRFRPAQQNQVYNNTRQVAPGGGNAIWESGVVRPDDVLADLIHIFHPELLPDHELVYYERLR
ncbi:MAG: ABC transporter substrate-binding protein [Opitutales bacterium]